MSEDDPAFVDTNILVYAYDIDAGPRHARANEVLVGLWETGAMAHVFEAGQRAATARLPQIAALLEGTPRRPACA